MTDEDRPSGTKNATILMFIAAALHIYFGFTNFQLSVIIPNPFQIFVGTIDIVIGLLTLCASGLVWLQNYWAVKITAVVGIAACAAAVIFGYYMMIILIAPLYWYAMKWVSTDPPATVSVWSDD